LIILLPILSTFGVINRRQIVTANDLKNVVIAWQNNTEAVSSFLNLAATYIHEAAFRSVPIFAMKLKNDQFIHEATIYFIFLQSEPDHPECQLKLAGNFSLGPKSQMNNQRLSVSASDI
jgi:hypothetical protein